MADGRRGGPGLEEGELGGLVGHGVERRAGALKWRHRCAVGSAQLAVQEI